tara:strand:- start:507 stop:1589 length:1083 start_codon:yes stop_codon:yes gene_type:complete
MTRINKHPNAKKHSYIRAALSTLVFFAVVVGVTSVIGPSNSLQKIDDEVLNYRPALYSRHAQEQYHFFLNLPSKDIQFDRYFELLDQEDYAGLDSLFEDYNARLLKDIQVEWEFAQLFMANPRSSLRYESQLDAWYRDSGSTYAQLMKASFYVNAGWSARGSKTIGETSASQISGMNEYHRMAISELQVILELRPDLFPAYLLFLQLERSQGDLVPLKELTEQVAARFPGSYHIARIMMKSYQPRWGGSLEEISTYYRDHIKPYENENKPLIRFRGYELSERGWRALRSGQVKRCVNFYTEAMQWGIAPSDLGNRAWCLEELNRTVQALDDIQLYLQLKEDEWARGQESYLIGRLKRQFE